MRGQGSGFPIACDNIALVGTWLDLSHHPRCFCLLESQIHNVLRRNSSWRPADGIKFLLKFSHNRWSRDQKILVGFPSTREFEWISGGKSEKWTKISSELVLLGIFRPFDVCIHLYGEMMQGESIIWRTTGGRRDEPSTEMTNRFLVTRFVPCTRFVRRNFHCVIANCCFGTHCT